MECEGCLRDSLFVYLPGTSRDRAFDIDEKIVDVLTRSNAYPVKLKFEMVNVFRVVFSLNLLIHVLFHQVSSSVCSPFK